MAFRKRNIALGPGRTIGNEVTSTTVPGVRPSPLTSHPTTSTGTASLDGLLGGHSGLALGSSLLIEESGTTDFAGALLRFYAAEGLCQGHVVHIVGLGDGWVRELPGIAEEKGSRRPVKKDDAGEKMRIAWRYESLGQAGERGAWQICPCSSCSRLNSLNIVVVILANCIVCHMDSLTCVQRSSVVISCHNQARAPRKSHSVTLSTLPNAFRFLLTQDSTTYPFHQHLRIRSWRSLTP